MQITVVCNMLSDVLSGVSIRRVTRNKASMHRSPMIKHFALMKAEVVSSQLVAMELPEEHDVFDRWNAKPPLYVP